MRRLPGRRSADAADGSSPAMVVEDEAGAHRRGEERVGPKKVAEPVAVSSTPPADFPLRPLRGATYDHPVVLRPTPAPRSAHEETYGLARPGARGRNRENVAICGR